MIPRCPQISGDRRRSGATRSPDCGLRNPGWEAPDVLCAHPGYALAAVGRISVNVIRRSAIEGHASGQQLQMPHRERAVPFVIEAFTHEPTVAVMRLRLGAQETRSVEQLRLETMLDSSFRHEVEKTRLVSRPLPLVLLVGLEHGVRRREQRLMHIRDPADPVEEIGEVIGLGKTGELRRIVQAHVHHLLHAGRQKPVEKPLRARLRKADRRNARFRQVSLLRGNRAMQVAGTGGPVGLRLCNPGRPRSRRGGFQTRPYKKVVS